MFEIILMLWLLSFALIGGEQFAAVNSGLLILLLLLVFCV